VDHLAGGGLGDLGRALQLTPPLERSVEPAFLTFSGGVAEYLMGHEDGDFGDIARELAASVSARLDSRVRRPVVDPGQRIRATVIGASQFTVQVSGKTIYFGDGVALPIQNVPVVHFGKELAEVVDADAVADGFRRAAQRQDRGPDQPLALALSWSGPPTHARLAALGRGIVAFAGGHAEPLLLVIDGDVGQSLGRLLDRELGLDRPMVAVDGIELADLDFVDVGELLNPPGVLPVVIKSLLFS
jgi:ethanolamine utilization protein EutA